MLPSRSFLTRERNVGLRVPTISLHSLSTVKHTTKNSYTQEIPTQDAVKLPIRFFFALSMWKNFSRSLEWRWCVTPNEVGRKERPPRVSLFAYFICHTFHRPQTEPFNTHKTVASTLRVSLFWTIDCDLTLSLSFLKLAIIISLFLTLALDNFVSLDRKFESF